MQPTRVKLDYFIAKGEAAFYGPKGSTSWSRIAVGAPAARHRAGGLRDARAAFALEYTGRDGRKHRR